MVTVGVEELRSFGLSAYEAQAYTALLATGPTDAATVGQRAGIPFGRVYDVLHALAGRNLVTIRDGRPKTFAPTPPAEAIEALLHARKRELAEEGERLGRMASTLEEQLARVSRAQQIRGATYLVSLGREDARRTLAEVVGEAKERILASLEFEQRYVPADRAVFEAIRGAAERGVEIRALLRPMDLQRILASGFVEPISELVLPHLGEGFDVRISDKALVPFSITDGQRVTLGVRDPLHPEQHFAVVVLKDPKVAADLTQRFEALWREGSDLWEAMEGFLLGEGPGEAQGKA